MNIRSPRNGLFGIGFTPRCSYKRGTVTIEWVNTAVEEVMKVARQWMKGAGSKCEK